jgi:DNA-binding transcriptional ArsR family regulator
LLGRLAEGGPASISTLSRSFRVSRQAVTKHLHSLSAAGLIRGRRTGREHIWTLNPDRLGDAQRCLETIATRWDTALARLKAHAER